jgi:hypothetical protein
VNDFQQRYHAEQTRKARPPTASGSDRLSARTTRRCSAGGGALARSGESETPLLQKATRSSAPHAGQSEDAEVQTVENTAVKKRRQPNSKQRSVRQAEFAGVTRRGAPRTADRKARTFDLTE